MALRARLRKVNLNPFLLLLFLLFLLLLVRVIYVRL